jgi:hypothetical protein
MRRRMKKLERMYEVRFKLGRINDIVDGKWRLVLQEERGGGELE